jgi:putative hydrolase of the HAD superfamily
MGNGRIWLFDLDNTLHNASAHVFPHINRGMTAYLERHLALSHEDANRLRMEYWKRYGATLLGLVRHHGTNPRHFLEETHRFDKLHECMVFDRALASMLRKLPGRKIVFSNGPFKYANAVLDAMSIRRHFSEIYCIEQMRFQPKPGIRAFRHLIADYRLNPRRCALVEDSAENLRTAKRLGMKTVLVGRGAKQPAYVDLKIVSILGLRRAAAALLC